VIPPGRYNGLIGRSRSFIEDTHLGVAPDRLPFTEGERNLFGGSWKAIVGNRARSEN
jgi:hypothetical protein